MTSTIEPTWATALAPLDDDSRYLAVRSRDARFDGWFFVAVTSTGIYCRPSCPSPPARASRVRFSQQRRRPSEPASEPARGACPTPLRVLRNGTDVRTRSVELCVSSPTASSTARESLA